MSFYNEIAKYYDFIFPTGMAQVQFIGGKAGQPPRRLLDAACGAGGYSIELAKQGYSVTAVDLNDQMIASLRMKIESTTLHINAIQGNMLELREKLNEAYDLAFCIGNSLVHLDGEEPVRKFLSDLRSLVVKDGNVILQIVNFDRVLAKSISSLPSIVNHERGITFKRIYRYDSEINRILFQTILEADGKQFANEVKLYPIQSESIIALLNTAGFNNIRLFGDFKGGEYDKLNSNALVILAS